MLRRLRPRLVKPVRSVSATSPIHPASGLDEDQGNELSTINEETKCRNPKNSKFFLKIFLKTRKTAEWLNAAHRWGEGELAPFSAEWDKNSHFPIDVIKASAEQGFMGLYTDPEYGGMGLSRLETSIIFEALSQHCVSTTAFMSIHNMGHGG